MRWILTAIFLLLVSIAPAQQTNLKKQVRIQKGLVRIDTIVQCIHQQTALKFSFNSKQISPSKKVMISGSLLRVEEILLEVENATGAKFKIVGSHIVLQNSPQKPAVKETTGPESEVNKKPITKNPKNTATQNHKQLIHHKTVTASLPAKKKRTDYPTQAKQNRAQSVLINHQADSVIDSKYSNSDHYDTQKVPLLILNPEPTIKAPLSDLLDSATQLSNDKSASQKPWWLAAGIQADELSYANPRLNIGYHNVYAIIGWNSGSCVCHTRMGIGSSFNLAATWQLHLTGTAGFTGAIYPQSTTLPEVTVKNGLYKISILAEKTIKKRFRIQAGPVINGLQTRYYSNDAQGDKQPVAPGTLLPAEMDGNKIYTSIEPLYTLIDTYKGEKTSNWKAWMGAELSVYYKIKFSLKK